jgi:septum site-determining protein MinC
MTTEPTPDLTPTSETPPSSSPTSSVTNVSAISQSLTEANTVPQVRFKSEGGRLLLLLPPDSEAQAAPTWNELLQHLKQRLNAGDRFWKEGTSIHLIARDRLLDARQLQAIADALSDANLHLKRVYTSRRQTAVAAATIGYSVEQLSPVTPLSQSSTESSNPLADPLYIQTTVRSGIEIRHPGSVVVLGDVNPGGSIVADGDVLVWGNLRGLAQAGANGNQQCLIMALRMEPTQIRIAGYVARAPESTPDQYHPEIAYVAPEGIRIARATDFPKMRLNSRSS